MPAIPYRESPVGEAIFPWLNNPDTKFNSNGLFKTDHAVSGEAAQKFKAEIDKACDEAFEELTKDMSAKEKKQWGVFHPYSVETDDDDHETGRVIFEYRQNAVIKVEGEPKRISIQLYDALGNELPEGVNIYAGSQIVMWHRPRPIKIASLKKAGVRLDFLKVQVIKLAKGKAPGFSKKEGYVAPTEPPEPEAGASEQPVDDDVPF